jgi:excinuclease UvrABC helicase subunit UvrB
MLKIKVMMTRTATKKKKAMMMTKRRRRRRKKRKKNPFLLPKTVLKELSDQLQACDLAHSVPEQYSMLPRRSWLRCSLTRE